VDGHGVPRWVGRQENAPRLDLFPTAADLDDQIAQDSADRAGDPSHDAVPAI
jgi:hypothetical protein